MVVGVGVHADREEQSGTQHNNREQHILPPLGGQWTSITPTPPLFPFKHIASYIHRMTMLTVILYGTTHVTGLIIIIPVVPQTLSKKQECDSCTYCHRTL